MALPILDGNQTAATLSTIITGGAHIPAHTVVSLGSQAISDITSGVSGSVVSISNFPSTQTIAGTVTANSLPDFYDASNDIYLSRNATFVEVAVDEFMPVGINYSLPISGTVTANVPISDISGGIADYISGTDSFVVSPLSGVTFPISGTVTANGIQQQVEDALFGSDQLVNSLNSSLLLSENVPISGTVTANVLGYDPYNGVYPSLPITRADDGIAGADNVVKVAIATELGGVNDSAPLPISGTVTANNPSGALTTRFGSVTTANTAQITSAVTNTSRKYLLAQNISAGTVTIGIGFSPTTTQGIQLTAGAGLTFDSFCPTGAVYWLGAVTGAAFTILEG